MQPLLIGKTEDGKRLELTAEDFETHLHGVGASRSGKSKLIEWIAREFVRRGQGFCLIDPHGSLYDDLLQWLTYLRPRQQIVLFNPSYQHRIVGFNPFRLRDGALSTQVDRLMRATLKAWGATSTDETPRLERWLRCGFHTVLEERLSVSALELLLGWKYPQVRNHFASRAESPLIRGEWDKLASYTRPQDFDGQVESTWNRIFRFLSSKELVRLMGVPSNAIDVEQIVEKGQILLVNLQPSPFCSREQVRLVGTLLIDEIWSVLDQRKRHGAQKPESFFLVIDEFQKYLTPDVADMLDESAKRGLHLLLFHQRLDQLRERDPEAYNAVTTNARLKLVFGGLNREDARTMAEQMFPGQIEFDKVKYFVEQTKFWPKYTRDVVTSRSSGSSSGLGSGIGQAWDPEAESWIDSPRSSDSSGDFESEGSTDVPMLIPEPFVERTPGAVFSLDDMLWQIADRLMEQYQRHFFIRRPGHETVAAVTPFVKPWTMSPKMVHAYVEKIVKPWFATADVDAALTKTRQDILDTARAAAEPVILATDSDTRPLKQKRPTLRKKGDAEQP